MDAASPETTNIANSSAIQRFPERQLEEITRTPQEARMAEKSGELILTDDQRKLVVRGKPITELVERTSAKGLTLDQRAVMLATAVSVDFDYFSRHSG